MSHGRNNGKKLMAIRIVQHCFELMHLITGKNPLQLLVDAVMKVTLPKSIMDSIHAISKKKKNKPIILHPTRSETLSF